MGGLSVLVLLGFLSVLLYAYIAIFLVIIIYVLVTYTFESIALNGICKNLCYKAAFTAWIPFYNKYLLGKIAGNKILGSILGIVNLCATLSGIYCYTQSTFLLQAFSIFLICILCSFILNIVLSEKIFKRAAKYGDVFTIFSVLSFGLLRPVFLFVVRNKISDINLESTSNVKNITEKI